MSELRRHRQGADRQQRAAEQAASWYLDQREGMNESRQAQFMAWLRQSPLHVQEYLAMARMHGDLAAAAALDPLHADQLDELAACDATVVPLRLGVQAPRTIAAAPTRHRRAHWLSQVAAAVVIAVIGATSWLAPPPEAWTAYASGSDELRSVALADGTELQLDRSSILAVRFDRDRRMIDVLHGGALFDAGHGDARPLHVRLGSNILQDIGTVFDAHQSDDGGNVTVISGRVKIWQRDNRNEALPGITADDHMIADLAAGQQASMHGDGSLDLIDHNADVASSTAWLPSDIRFERATVTEVARRFNAYSIHPLHIDDAGIAATRISGRFHARDMEAFIAYLRTLPGVRVVRGASDIRVVGGSHDTHQL
ncbi:MAG TPA: FecR domain-containing protein [Dyella sp.]|uniref:FecR family protein n=1 Tax=Dyella sp. TaxID=1869338 RepID=UPI002D79E621|nr:FecR domain-containing protein [Dyella sp.]HET6555624.1 FecR domain-containing protein [Dyella sp.]